MNDKLGLIHIYTGDGKGKTTAAIGLAVRAVGNGKKVVFSQFMKGQDSSERNVLLKLEGLKLFDMSHEFGFYFKMNEEEKNQLKAMHNEILSKILYEIEAGNCDVLVMDEVVYAYEYEAMDMELFNKIFFETKGVEIVITGRNPKKELMEKADYISEIKAVRHPIDKGVYARAGIEF